MHASARAERSRNVSSRSAQPAISRHAMRTVCRLRKRRSDKHERHAEHEQRGRMPESPREPERRCPPDATVPLGRDERRGRNQMVRIGRMPEAKQNGNCQHHNRTPAVSQPGDQLIDAEHAIPASSRRR